MKKPISSTSPGPESGRGSAVSVVDLSTGGRGVSGLFLQLPLDQVITVLLVAFEELLLRVHINFRGINANLEEVRTRIRY